MARLREACSCPLATPWGLLESWRRQLSQRAEEAEAGLKDPHAATVCLSACRPGGEEGLEQWAGRDRPGRANHESGEPMSERVGCRRQSAPGKP
eukprot:scaffold67089_cov34-Tisochrysis_lutea.AAC.1